MEGRELDIELCPHSSHTLISEESHAAETKTDEMVHSPSANFAEVLKK